MSCHLSIVFFHLSFVLGPFLLILSPLLFFDCGNGVRVDGCRNLALRWELAVSTSSGGGGESAVIGLLLFPMRELSVITIRLRLRVPLCECESEPESDIESVWRRTKGQVSSDS